MTKYAPILLFVYNRPAPVTQTKERRQNNTLAADSKIDIYAGAGR